MNKVNEAINQLQKGIERYVDIKVGELQYDKTYNGFVVGVNDDNTYKVKINNVEYDNIRSVGGTCSLYDTVKVQAPMNNFNNLTIFGVTDRYATTKYVDDLFNSIVDLDGVQF